MKLILSMVFSLFLISSASASLEEIFGNAEVGDTCSSDYQCQGLCCKSNTEGSWACANHSAQNTCAKSVGESCISSEFCAKTYVPFCKLVKTGVNPDGSPSCAVRCPSTLVNGECVNNVCRPPTINQWPPIDSSNCSGAVDP